MGYQPKIQHPSYNCPAECMGMLGCQCHKPLPKPLRIPAEPRPRGYGAEPLNVSTVLAVSDGQGRMPSDPLFRLPHSKCSCHMCQEWRAKNWPRLSQ